MYYPSPESIELFSRLYYNTTGLTDKFINYWKVVAKKFANNLYVVGYDPLNEPFPSNMFSDLSLLYSPGKFDRVALEPLYTRAWKEAY